MEFIHDPKLKQIRLTFRFDNTITVKLPDGVDFVTIEAVKDLIAAVSKSLQNGGPGRPTLRGKVRWLNNGKLYVNLRNTTSNYVECFTLCPNGLLENTLSRRNIGKEFEFRMEKPRDN